MRQKKLTWAVIFLIILLLVLTGYTLYYLVHNKEVIQDNLRAQLSNQVAGIRLPKGSDGPIGATGNPGMQGIQGSPGVQGIQGTQGLQGLQGIPGSQGIQGVTGDTGPTGTQGETGPPGRTLEQRCNPNAHRIEQKYTDTETWEIAYYLPTGAKCPDE